MSHPDHSVAFKDLFEAVQLRRLFPDSKTFPDMEPRSSPDRILAAWRDIQPCDDAALRSFVEQHFAPSDAAAISAPVRKDAVWDQIAATWPVLVRRSDAPAPGGSELWLPNAYVVPGGRFRETYYWDSYFTMLGLLIDGHADLVEGMIDNFVSLIERFGHIPNGNRSYFLSRSQPPFFACMLALSSAPTPADRERRLKALMAEHDYWQRGAWAARQSGASKHVVAMPDGSLLNRYWDSEDRPRQESYAEDVHTAKLAARPAGEVYRDIRAGAESGWDFSSRWLAEGGGLETIRTTSIVPVDLNCLLYLTESKIARDLSSIGQAERAAHYRDLAARRQASINRYLWQPAEERYADWLATEQRPIAGLTAATLFPLFAGVASAEQATAVARTARDQLMAPGGLRTTVCQTGEQWDMPNGWAPLQWIAAEGLRRYGDTALADEIAGRWVGTVARTFNDTGELFEKYDIERWLPAGGGEYDNQIGFGWTNGVTQAFLARANLIADGKR